MRQTILSERQQRGERQRRREEDLLHECLLGARLSARHRTRDVRQRTWPSPNSAAVALLNGLRIRT
jgi:hypothetical protein